MRLFAIAIDYDGTMALADVVDPAVRDAIAAARTRGIVVLLATGRILDELRRVAGDLHFVDAVIAENGAVLHFPESGHTTRLAPAVPPAFAEALNRQRITHQAGQCLVDAAAADAPRLLENALAPLDINSNPDTINRVVQEMAAAVRAVRPDARQGDLFTDTLGAELRRRIAAALASHGLTPGDVLTAEAVEGIDAGAPEGEWPVPMDLCERDVPVRAEGAPRTPAGAAIPDRRRHARADRRPRRTDRRLPAARARR